MGIFVQLVTLCGFWLVFLRGETCAYNFEIGYEYHYEYKADSVVLADFQVLTIVKVTCSLQISLFSINQILQVYLMTVQKLNVPNQYVIYTVSYYHLDIKYYFYFIYFFCLLFAGVYCKLLVVKITMNIVYILKHQFLERFFWGQVSNALKEQ